jgi:hypothetical protein
MARSFRTAYGGSMDAYFRHGVNAPKADPMPLVPLMAQRRGATRKGYSSGSTLRDTLMEF